MIVKSRTKTTPSLCLFSFLDGGASSPADKSGLQDAFDSKGIGIGMVSWRDWMELDISHLLLYLMDFNVQQITSLRTAWKCGTFGWQSCRGHARERGWFAAGRHVLLL